MGIPFHLDTLTVFVCCLAMLVAMATVMRIVSGRRIDTNGCLRIWTWQMWMLFFVGMSYVTSMLGHGASAQWLYAIAGPLAMAAVTFQALSVRCLTHGNVRTRTIALAVLGACLLDRTLALLPLDVEWRVSLLAYALIRLSVLPGLLSLARQSRGCRMLCGASILDDLVELLSATFNAPIDSPYVILAGYLTVLVGSVGLLRWNEERLQTRLADLAVTDALTGALNRHGLGPRLEREIHRAREGRRPLSVVLCDLDHFKQVNDVHGHGVGDAVLCRFVQRSKLAIRPGDLVGRWGGEEFLIVLPDTALQDAVAIAERVRKMQAEPDAAVPRVTVSLGVAMAGSDAGEQSYDVAGLIATADHRLYVAKVTRDRVVHLDKPESEGSAHDPQASAVLS